MPCQKASSISKVCIICVKTLAKTRVFHWSTTEDRFVICACGDSESPAPPACWQSFAAWDVNLCSRSSLCCFDYSVRGAAWPLEQMLQQLRHVVGHYNIMWVMSLSLSCATCGLPYAVILVPSYTNVIHCRQAYMHIVCVTKSFLVCSEQEWTQKEVCTPNQYNYKYIHTYVCMSVR